MSNEIFANMYQLQDHSWWKIALSCFSLSSCSSPSHDRQEGTPAPKRSARADRQKAERVPKQILPRATYEGITYNVVAKQK